MPSIGGICRPRGPYTYADEAAAGDGTLRLSDAVLDAPPAWRITRWTWSALPPPARTWLTSPSTGHRIDSACGPMSHKAPLTCRHGESANGPPPLRASEANSTLPQSHAPSCVACCSHATNSGTYRRVKKTIDATPA